MARGVPRTESMRPRYLMLLLTVLPVIAPAQLFTFGVKGGVPAQTPLGQTDSRMPFVLGPTVEAQILPRLSLESGVLFHRMGQQSNLGVILFPQNQVTLFPSRERARALEFPFLVKYRLLSDRRVVRPFVEAGPAVRRVSLAAEQSSSTFSATSLRRVVSQPVVNTKTVKWSVDPVFGTGVDFKTGRFHLEPEARYSYWRAGKNSSVRKNQVGFLLGFRL